MKKKVKSEKTDINAVNGEVSIDISEDFESEIRISDDVIASIVNINVRDEPGVHTLQDSIPNMIIKSKNAQGVKVVRLEDKSLDVKNDKLIVDIYINLVVDFGTKILNACDNIQKNVKIAVENLCSIEVNTVNVNVVGVYSEKVGNVSKI